MTDDEQENSPSEQDEQDSSLDQEWPEQVINEDTVARSLEDPSGRRKKEDD